MFAESSIEAGMLTPEVVRSIVREAQNAIGRETRKLNKTGATKRTGKHRKLDPDAKAAREAARRVRKTKREEDKETIAEAAKIRWARRRAEEDERAARRRLRIHVPKEKEPKVTAAGGRKYARSYQRFERQVLPMLPARMPAGSTALVFRIKSRRLGGHGKSRWRKSELVNFLRYLTRPQSLAAEPEAAVFTNISQHEPGTDAFARELAAFGQVVENLEGAIDPNGQVYHSGVIPLPWEIGSEAHCRIAQTVQRAFATRGLPCLVVVHAPDPGSDWRNVHLHLAVVTRSFTRHGERDWSFAPTRSRDVFHPAMMTVWRRYLVSALNRELAQTASERRYTLEAANAPAVHLGRARTEEGRRTLLAVQTRHTIAVSEEAGCLAVKEVADKLVRSTTRLRASGAEIIRLALATKKAGLHRQADQLAGLRERSKAIQTAMQEAWRRKTIEKLRMDLHRDRDRLRNASRDLAVRGKVARLVLMQRSLRAQADPAATLAARLGEVRHQDRATRTLTSSRDAMQALQSRASAVSTRLGVLNARIVRDRRLHDLKASLIARGGAVASSRQRIERVVAYVNAYPGFARARELISAQRKRIDTMAAQLAGMVGRDRTVDSNSVAVDTDSWAVEHSRSAVAEAADPNDALHSFDKAAVAVASSCSEAFERLLAFARLAIVERRLIVRRNDDVIELAAVDDTTLASAFDLAARPLGRQVLRQAVELSEVPAEWRRARFPAFSQVDRHEERLVLLARQAALRRSSPADREGLIHDRIDRASQAGLLDGGQVTTMKSAAGRKGLFFTINLQRDTAGAYLTLAAADLHVLSILTDLLKNAEGLDLLVDLAQKNALGDYPARGDWAAHIVKLKARTKAREEPNRELPQPGETARDHEAEPMPSEGPAPPEGRTQIKDSSFEPGTSEELSYDVLSAAHAANVKQR